MAFNWYPASSLIGGGTGALDAISGSALVDGDRAIVVTSTAAYFYILDATSGAAESSPDIISPDSFASTKRWLLKTVFLPLISQDSTKNSVILGDYTSTWKNAMSGGDAEYCAIVGGLDNDMSGTTTWYSAIIGGYDNDMSGSDLWYNAIVGGYENIISGASVSNCAMIGGGYNRISGTGILDCCISGGYDNKISGDEVWYSGIFGGYDNELSGDEIWYSGIFGGYDNEMASDVWYCSIIGGSANVIQTDAWYSGILAGTDCFISSAYRSAILNGDNNIIKGAQDSLVSGSGNRLCAGSTVKAAVATGKSAKATLFGQRVHGGGLLSSIGDVQISDLLMKKETTDATKATLLLDALTYLPLKEPKTYQFKFNLVARQTAGVAGTAGDSATWEAKGAIKNVGAVAAQGTVTISGTVAENDTISLNGITYTFKTSPSGDQEVQAGTSTTAGNSFVTKLNQHHNKVFSVVRSVNDVLITTHTDLGTAPNSYAFTSSGANISCDGAGTFGGTTAGAAGTVSFVGLSGTMYPPKQSYDTAASAWDVEISSDDTNKGMKIEVTGEADKTIHWVAKISMVEVG